ncbi:MAG: hypothetical protein J5564_02825, partial [Clostridia bacterium]|nr:hypothetical protein [Clostridia bacterium]
LLQNTREDAEQAAAEAAAKLEETRSKAARIYRRTYPIASQTYYKVGDRNYASIVVRNTTQHDSRIWVQAILRDERGKVTELIDSDPVDCPAGGTASVTLNTRKDLSNALYVICEADN